VIYKIGILGASGRMGMEICGLLSAGFELKGDWFELADPVVGSKKMTQIDGVETRTIDETPREPVHAWIDFSRPAGTMKLLDQISGPVLIGTTGFNDAERGRIEAYAKKHPVLLASNTSLGMNLMFRILGSLPKLVTENFEIVLREEHHRGKVDAPSGTAKSLLQILEKSGAKKIDVQVIRAGTIPGVHSVRLITDDEEIEIVHRVSERKVFAKGALVGLSYLVKQKRPGLYSMQEAIMEEKA